jgi:hypothetical protein
MESGDGHVKGYPQQQAPLNTAEPPYVSPEQLQQQQLAQMQAMPTHQARSARPPARRHVGTKVFSTHERRAARVGGLSARAHDLAARRTLCGCLRTSRRTGR